MAKVVERCVTGGYPYEVFATLLSHSRESAEAIAEEGRAASRKSGLKDVEYVVVDDEYKLQKLYSEGV